MSTTSAPTMNEMRAETNWPVLKSYLEDGKVSFEDLKLPCGICRDTMTVLPSQHQTDEDGMTHSAMIFPCGHIFGKSCIELAFAEGSDLGRVCFACRADITYTECKHVHAGTSVPSTKEGIKDIPGILSKEGEMAERCGGCLLEYTSDKLIDEVSKVNASREDGCLMGFTCRHPPSGKSKSWTPMRNGQLCTVQGGDTAICKPTEEAMWSVTDFQDEQDRINSGKCWFQEGKIDLEWEFYLWNPPMTENAAFHEYVDYKYLMEGETATGMTMEELRAEFFGKPMPLAKPKTRRLMDIYLELKAQGFDDDDDDDEDED
ncbi:hypothetical protein NXS19_008574 [Fusarium pseudograminearum]|nr:hypothetical protein FPSE5266_04908 [Fusarium pseudograminearum]QPC78358.1 hypothetical protein HYE68_009110 [Fusarium pseudograminearum]UZP40758.1 hypothetical protein NXS19_008574 [Fusarium pseudograminearum]